MDKGVRRLIEAVATTRLVYGEPVRDGERTIIPVTRVKVSGGWGTGRGTRQGKQGDAGFGSGGGGSLDAAPAGYIELGGPEGSRFVEIPDPERSQRLLKTGAAALATLVTGVAGARKLGRGGRRRPAGLLRPGR